MKKISTVIPFPGSPYKPPRAPAGLGRPGKALWKAIQTEYRIADSGGVAHLTAACRCEDDLCRMRALVATDGTVVLDRFKQTKAHPLIAQICAMEAARRAALQTLNLDLEPLRDRPGRPAGR